MRWYGRPCPSCGGSLHDDEDPGWVACLMCGRSFALDGAPRRIGEPVRSDRLGRMLQADARLVAAQGAA